MKKTAIKKKSDGSDYEPDEGEYKPKKTVNRGGHRGSAKKRRGRGYDMSSDEDGSDSGSSGEEWGKKKRKGKGRRKKKKLDDSDEGSFASSDSDSEPKKDRRTKKQKETGFTRTLTLSEDLEAIVGTNKAPRHEVVKQMWAYIKENDLQDPKNKQFAICDEKLEKVIGEKRFKCFGMAKYLKEHMS